MNSYNLQKRISSFYVDKRLVQDIEDFFFKDIPEILPWIKAIKDDQLIEIKVYDSFGEERLSKIQDHKQHLFRDDTRALTIEYKGSFLEKNVNILIRFSKEVDEADITINLMDQKAREGIAAIEQGVESVLNQKRTINWVLYPTETLGLLVSFITLASGIILISDNIHPIFRKVSGIVFILLFIFYIARKLLKPYSSFDTNRQKKYDTFFNWFLLALLGFILFTTVATSIRQNLFGF